MIIDCFFLLHFLCRKLVLVLFLFSTLVAIGQRYHVGPSSPSASRLIKDIRYPVGYDRGTPKISVPLYDMEVRGIRFPLNLNYRSGGFKINEKSSEVGLGWGLDCDMQITREINGNDDLFGRGYTTNGLKMYMDASRFQTALLPRYNYEFTRGIWDGEPDIFHYKLLDKSGTFHFMSNDAGFKVVSNEGPAIRIVYERNAFVITDSDGTVYYFGNPNRPNDGTDSPEYGVEMTPPEAGTSRSIMSWKCLRLHNSNQTVDIRFRYRAVSRLFQYPRNASIEYYDNKHPGGMPREYPYIYTTPEWLARTGYQTLEDIGRQIGFYALSSPKVIVNTERSGGTFTSYTASDVEYDMSSGTYKNQLLQWSVPLKYRNSTGPMVSSSMDSYLGLESISFNTGESYIFTWTGDRLNSIQVQTGTNLLRKIAFHQSDISRTESGVNGAKISTWYLDSLSILDQNSLLPQKYGFLYEEKYNFGPHLQGSDAWGYANRRTSMESTVSIPRFEINQPIYIQKQGYSNGWGEMTGSNMGILLGGDTFMEHPDELSTKRGTLVKIMYPTGGFTTFDYELNKYLISFDGYFKQHWEEVMPAGGLRIKSIRNFNSLDAVVPTESRFFHYGEDGAGLPLYQNDIGLVPFTRAWSDDPERMKYHFFEYKYTPFSNTMYMTYVKDNLSLGVSNDPKIFEVIADEEKITFRPRSHMNLDNSYGGSVYYPKVTEYTFSPDKKVNGKKEYNYINPENMREEWQYYFQNEALSPFSTRFFNGTNVRKIDNLWMLGHLQNEKSYVYKDGKYILAHSKESKYKPLIWQNSLVMKVYPNRSVNALTPTMPTYYDSYGNVVDYNPKMHSPRASTRFSGQEWELYEYYGSSFIPCFYELEMGKMLLKEEREISYDDQGRPTEKMVSYEYDGDKLREIQLQGSNGKVSKTILKYPKDFAGTGNAAIDKMLAANIVEPVVDRTILAGEGSLWKNAEQHKTDYAIFSPGGKSMILPSKVSESYGTEPLRTKIRYDAYDDQGNILQLTENESLRRSFVWGYQQRRPVLEVINRPFTDVGVHADMNIIGNPETEQSLLNHLESIRQKYSGENVQIKNFIYNPYLNLSTYISSSGQRESYFYDSFQRLLGVRDHQGHVVRSYDYKLLPGNIWSSIFKDKVVRQYIDPNPLLVTDVDRNFPYMAGRSIIMVGASGGGTNFSDFVVKFKFRPKNGGIPLERSVTIYKNIEDSPTRDQGYRMFVPAGDYYVSVSNSAGYRMMKEGQEQANSIVIKSYSPEVYYTETEVLVSLPTMDDLTKPLYDSNVLIGIHRRP